MKILTFGGGGPADDTVDVEDLTELTALPRRFCSSTEAFRLIGYVMFREKCFDSVAMCRETRRAALLERVTFQLTE